MKRVLTAVLTFVMAFSVMTFFTACGDNNVAKEGTLSIKYYEGGYGYEWIEDFAARFKAQTGKEVAIERSTNVATTAEDEMSSGNAYDIYISHGMPIFRMAARGLLADLTDVYESDIEGTKFEQRVIPAAREMAKFKVGGAEKYVMVPYTQGVGGLVYNKTMFAANKWKVPETYAELVALCATINGTPGLKDKNGDKVTPFVWSNALSYMWDYVVCDWWAQMSGINKVNEFFESRLHGL